MKSVSSEKKVFQTFLIRRKHMKKNKLFLLYIVCSTGIVTTIFSETEIGRMSPCFLAMIKSHLILKELAQS